HPVQGPGAAGGGPWEAGPLRNRMVGRKCNGRCQGRDLERTGGGAMKIDVSRPEGNTLTALGIATNLLRDAGRSKEDIEALTRAVFSAKSAKEARDAITEATYGSIEFY